MKKALPYLAAGAAGLVAGVVLVNLAALPTFGIVGDLYKLAKAGYGSDWRNKVKSLASAVAANPAAARL